MPIKRNIYIMCAISLLQGMVFYGSIATLYRQASGVGVLEISIIESVSLALCVLLELPWGILADKIGYRKSMMICCALYFISKIVFWRADSFIAFLIERVILSVVIAGLTGVDTSVIYLSCAEGKSQKAFGWYNSMGTAGLLAASAVYTLFIGANYRAAALATCISYALAAVLSLWLIEVKPPETRRVNHLRAFFSTLKGALTDRKLILLIIGVALINETHQSITVWLNQLKYVACGLTDKQIGAVYVAVTLAGLLGALSARLTDKLGRVKTGGAIYVTAIAACVALAITQTAVVAIIAVIALRIAFSLFQPLQIELQNKAVKSDDRATALSINAVIIDGVTILASLGFGALAEANLTLALGFGAGICALGLVMYIIAAR